MEMQDVLTTVNGNPLTVANVLEHLKARGIFRSAIYELIELEVLRFEAASRKIEITEAEMNDFLDAKRYELGLADAIAVADYCRWLGITYETWVEAMRNELLRARLRGAIVTGAMVEQHFLEHVTELKTVSVARIVTTSRTAIDAAIAMLNDGNGDFGAVARRFSIETATQNVGGYVGVLRPGMLPREIDEPVFAAKANEIIGPVQSLDRWYLYKVIDVEHGELSEQLHQQIAENLFESWLSERTRQTRA